jgi:hypothetical protein
MGKLTGAVFVVAGVTIAAYAMAERQRTVAESAASAVTQPAKSSATKASAAPGSGLEVQAKVDGAAPGAQLPPTAPPASPPAAEKNPEPKTPALDGKSAQTPPLQIAEAPPRVPVDYNKSARTAPLDREGRTRAIQHHLKRVGCYGGAISGEWTPAVRQAMKTFTERVNATLPVEEPDDILLALVQNHRQTACGANACPPGRAKGDNGACQPHAVIAKKTNVPPPGDTGGPTTHQASTPAERMSLAGPQPPQKRAARSRRSHYSDVRSRERRRAAAPGMPWWAGPLFWP